MPELPKFRSYTDDKAYHLLKSFRALSIDIHLKLETCPLHKLEKFPFKVILQLISYKDIGFSKHISLIPVNFNGSIRILKVLHQPLPNISNMKNLSNKKPFIENWELERDIANLSIPLDDQMLLPATDEEVIKAYGKEGAQEMGLLKLPEQPNPTKT